MEQLKILIKVLKAEIIKKEKEFETSNASFQLLSQIQDLRCDLSEVQECLTKFRKIESKHCRLIIDSTKGNEND